MPMITDERRPTNDVCIRRLWLARNRPQGLVDSLDRLEIALN